MPLANSKSSSGTFTPAVSDWYTPLTFVRQDCVALYTKSSKRKGTACFLHLWSKRCIIKYKSNHISSTKFFCLFYTNNLLFLFYKTTLTKLPHQYIYYTLLTYLNNIFYYYFINKYLFINFFFFHFTSPNCGSLYQLSSASPF